ncbi:NADH:ubiquinone reductase (Na(+)-transporting) subunit B [Desulfoluna spongiiphila]|uniref:Na(+)-translocating NADH-quinone reductase subunit B n=1 Tax=Desulfoluna spongiiphila TaxID=419481 RepID=A0A1G5GB04_9BACT|nr:NADH:ubiquinone reductase (Na(+)-transporting) subunit B [Desulfoluna spongiiphila]SCY48683.1 Na+-transporting NADH:ubiquinone oxidoreductase subunit B [Desulfoluna spongiiphila]VVS93670.1 na(+)-translocating nadh-quinone reductase subunit b [Desulfoluna spongiiphila]
MKNVKNALDRLGTYFQEGTKLQALHPVYDAIRTIFFVPGEATVRMPAVRDSLDLKRFMSLVIVALIPQTLFGMINTGTMALVAEGVDPTWGHALYRGSEAFVPMLVVSYGVGLTWEGIFAVVRGHKISEGFLVTGLLFPLTLPPSVPLWQVAAGISFGVVVGKEVFGGTGRNILNPALTARAFLFFSYPVSMSGDNVWVATKAVDAVTAATPLSLALGAKGEAVPEALVRNGYTFWTMFSGQIPGSVGETSALLCLISAVFLCMVGVASFRIIVGGVLGVCAMGSAVVFLSSELSPWHWINPVNHLIMGGFAFGITFMATDPVSAPGTDGARWVYGFFIGVLTVIVRAYNLAYAEGVMLAILFMNLFSPMLEILEIKLRTGKRVPNV